VPKEMGVTAPATSMPTSIVPPACRRRNVPSRRALICCVACACASRHMRSRSLFATSFGRALSAGLNIEHIRLAADTAGMAKKPESPKLFWLTYRHPDGRTASVVVIESRGLLHARLMASLVGADLGLEFASGQQLDPESAGQIPANMIGRFLDDGDLQKLHQALLKKKPPAPSVTRQTATKRKKWANNDLPQGRSRKRNLPQRKSGGRIVGGGGRGGCQATRRPVPQPRTAGSLPFPSLPFARVAASAGPPRPRCLRWRPARGGPTRFKGLD
jgi:hypothetical protein